MATIAPFTALRYDLGTVGSFDAVASPPYDVIDASLRAELAGKSEFNVVHIDLPEGEDRYTNAATRLQQWIASGAVVQDDPAIWVLTQEYVGPDGTTRTRHGFFCRVGVEPYGPGRIRPHERTHPGPKQDRLALMHATKANLSPIFSLFSDPEATAWNTLEPFTETEPFGVHTDADGTINRLWRVTDLATIESVTAALADKELLIADGHHRYETARAYADEIGGEGDHNFVMMFLCALQDSGMTVFPTHRLIKGTTREQQEAIAAIAKESFEITEVTADQLVPQANGGTTSVFGYYDSFHRKPWQLTLKDQAVADAALPGKPEPYRTLDTAVLEALMLKGALGMTDDDISHLNGLGYSSDKHEAQALVDSGEYDAGFFLQSTPLEQVQAVAEAGETMPPKSTYFYPKIPTGLLFNPLG